MNDTMPHATRKLNLTVTEAERTKVSGNYFLGR